VDSLLDGLVVYNQNKATDSTFLLLLYVIYTKLGAKQTLFTVIYSCFSNNYGSNYKPIQKWISKIASV
jgi:hypothetical protein